MKYRTDLILGEAFCIFIFFYFLDSGLSVLNGLQFYFDCVTVKTPHRKDILRRNKNYFELAGGSSYRGQNYSNTKCMKEILGKSTQVRVSARFELARVRVIESRLKFKGPQNFLGIF